MADISPIESCGESDACYDEDKSDSGNDSDELSSDVEDIDCNVESVADDLIDMDLDNSASQQVINFRPQAFSSGNGYTYKVFDSDEIVECMVQSIKDVNSILQIPSTTARLLLNHFKWDKEKLMETFYSDSQEKMFKDAKIPILQPFSPVNRSLQLESTSNDHNVRVNSNVFGDNSVSHVVISSECEICYLTLPNSLMCGLETCGHEFCKVCWKEYLSTKIMKESMFQFIECPHSTCHNMVEDATVFKLISDPEVDLKYHRLISNSFVVCNRLMKWCPAPDCKYAILVNHVEPKRVVCTCSFEFCFACSSPWHDPVKCDLIVKWVKKCDEDNLTANWISINTKECPKCKATIEKDGGCNHMTCKNQACRADFCWVCLGPWEPHGSSWYNCNIFENQDAKDARSAQETSRVLLQRYLFYCNRYINHQKSLKFENKLYSMVKGKMEELQRLNMSWIEVQFLKKAVDVLCECRRTLMYTYVFAYYIEKNNQSQLFEVNQKDLESSTETLSEYLERDISAENSEEVKRKVQDKYRYCESRRNALLEHVHEGYERDWWQLTPVHDQLYL